MHTILNYNKIMSGIYIGTNACCLTHFSQKLKTKGVSADISLEEERLDNPKGVSFFIWLPVKDHTPPTQDQLNIGINVIDSLLKLKKKYLYTL